MYGVQYMTPRRHPGYSQERDNPYCWTNSKDESENETKKLEWITQREVSWLWQIGHKAIDRRSKAMSNVEKADVVQNTTFSTPTENHDDELWINDTEVSLPGMLEI